MDKVLSMTYASSLTQLCEVNSSFDAGVLRICYPGENRNGSFISKDVIEKSIKSIYNCPLVCSYDRESDTLGGHDMEVVRDCDGNLKIINSTTPVGVVPEGSRVWFEDYEEQDGTIHEYLYADVLLWKRQEAYQKIKNDGITAHSMEIKVNQGKVVDGVYHVDDFEFTAFCLIGVEPCFEGSSLETFAKDNFKLQLSEMMHDLKETFTMVNSSKEDDNTHPQNDSTKGGQRLLDEKLKLAAKYGIDVNSLDFSIEDLTIKDLTNKFEQMQSMPKEDDSNKDFELVSNTLDELIRVLSHETVSSAWGEEPRYWYVDCDLEINEVYCRDANDWLLYGFTFSIDGDSITIDFDSKKRKKYIIADFDDGEQDSPIEPIFELVEKKLKEYAEIETKFNATSDTIASMQTELDTLRKFKEDVDKESAQNERDEVFAQFNDLNGIEAYESLKKQCTDYDIATLEEKCFAIRGRNASTLQFSTKAKTPKLKIEKPSIQNEPYGGLVEKYAPAASTK